MQSNYVIPASLFTGSLIGLGLTYALSLVVPFEYRQMAIWTSLILFIPSLILSANEYTGSGSDMLGAHDNAGIGVHHAGKTHRSVGNKNTGLLEDIELMFGLRSIGLYGGFLSLLIAIIML